MPMEVNNQTYRHMNRKLHFHLSVLLIGCASLLRAQDTDTLPPQQLEKVTITSYRSNLHPVHQLEPVHGDFIVAGKKNEIIRVQDLPANLSEKSARQLFAKVPGVFVYDMDGSGNQVNIATRGLDPHRSWS